MRQRAALSVVSLLALVAVAPVYVGGSAVRSRPAVTAADTVPDSIEVDRTSRPVAPGVTLSSFDRLESGGWLRAQSLSVDLTGGNGVEYLSSDKVASVQTVADQVKQRPRAVAAINGDFFDINDTNAPEGVGISDGTLVKSPDADHTNAIGIGPSGAGRILQVYFDGTVTLPGGTRPLDQYNGTRIATNGIGEYTSAWGGVSLARPVQDATDAAEVTIHNGVVAAAATAPSADPIAAGDYALVGREAGADALRALAPGDKVSVTYRPKTSDGSAVRTAIGGNQLLVVDGQVQQPDDDGLAARSAIGFNRDGTKMYALTVDGKQTDSVGITVPEMAQMMLEMGAYNAINIDGGGSSTLLARQPGTDNLALENSPSDGSQRPVANGLAITAPAGSGKLHGFWVSTVADPAKAPTADPRPGGHPDRVFPGLTRRLSATGYDETYGPAAGTPRWRATGGTVDRDGVFHAGRTGTAKVVAYQGDATGSMTLDVLGALQRIGSSTPQVSLSDPDEAGSFGVVGYDSSGDSAPIEPSDASLDYDHSLLSIGTDNDGNFTVKALRDSGATLITVHVGQYSTVIPVTVGLTDETVANFDDAAQWTFSAARATGSLSAVDGHDGTGLQLSYDFTQSTGTRAAYAAPPRPIQVPGQPRSFGLWIYGNGHGEWPTLDFVDAQGTEQLLRGDYVTWTGWKYVTFTVPSGVAYPLTLNRFYVAETRADTQYTGSVVIDGLTAQVPPSADAPDQPTVRDPVVIRNGTLDGRTWRFAVMSDAELVAGDPDSDAVAAARRTLREIRAAKPDFLIIDGDLAGSGSPDDLKFAHQLLDDELGGAVPWYYVPGNGEVAGGSIDDFSAEFGPAYRTFDHKGTRFITLDTSSLSLRGGGMDQVEMLRDELDSAATDPDIDSVVVVQHVPPRDPVAPQANQLTDRKEAELEEDWLSDFAGTTGKGVAFIGGHAGVFGASHVDGVPYVLNGDAGAVPDTPADQGGFVGWTELGVDPVSAAQQAGNRANPYHEPGGWLAAQTHPQVGGLTLSTPDTMDLGQTATVTASLTQAGRTIPVSYPVSADWSVTGHAVRFDPDTGTLTAVHRGTATVTLVVNGTSVAATVAVT